MKIERRATAFSALLFALVTLGLTPVYAADIRNVDVVSITWLGAKPPVGTNAAIAEIVDKDVSLRWKAMTTLYGDTKDRAITFVAGKVLAEPISLTLRLQCGGGQSIRVIENVRTEAYKRLGISDFSKRYLIINAPSAGCIWSGRALTGTSKSTDGVMVLHNSDSAFVITHELGHAFGLGHSNFLKCGSGARDGAWGSDCKGVEYGGVIDVMGNVDTTSPLSTYHQWRMGLLDSTDVKQSWVNETITLAPSDYANGTRAIFLRDGKSTYWVEYRRELSGVNYKSGLVIYRTDPPPADAIVTPNPIDPTISEYDTGVSTDMWLLNLDSYIYANGKTSGSATLPKGASFTTFSGNITFGGLVAEDGNSVSVVIKRKADSKAPPVPELIDISQWKYPGIEIIKGAYDDGESAIGNFEARIDGVITPLTFSTIDYQSPTYLNPLSRPKTLRVTDLPEGSYSLSIRASDVWGNISDWSKPVDVQIDRGRPVVTNDFTIAGFSGEQTIVAWSGAKDAGSGLCQTNLVDTDGYILQSSSEKSSPRFTVPTGTGLAISAQVFDCIGNGIVGNLSLKTTFVAANSFPKSGRWTSAPASYGAGALKCINKCTVVTTQKGNLSILVGDGSASVTSGSTTVAQIALSTSGKARLGATLELGADRKSIRIRGSNFIFVGFARVSGTFTNSKALDRTASAQDPSLADSKQLALSKIGFNPNDFSQEWTILPMSKGTTLADPTLDLCSITFASEKERIERRQVIATKVANPFIFLSTEIVRYSSPATANIALKELIEVKAQCVINKGFKDVTDRKIEYNFFDIPPAPNNLVSESSRVLVNAQIGTGANARQLLGFYQFNGALFTGLYIVTTGETPFTDAQVKKWLSVAGTMADRMARLTQ